MIRFIDLRGQILLDTQDPYFAFFNTVSDTFLSFNEEQVWHDWQEFESCYREETGSSIGIERYESLLPPWIFK